jgi:chromosome segregation ATPase
MSASSHERDSSWSLEELRTNYDKLFKAYGDLKHENYDHTSEIEHLEMTAKDRDKKIEALEKNMTLIAELMSQNEALGQSLRDKDAATEDHVENTIAPLRDDNRELRAKAGRLQGEVTSLKEEVKSLKQEQEMCKCYDQTKPKDPTPGPKVSANVDERERTKEEAHEAEEELGWEFDPEPDEKDLKIEKPKKSVEKLEEWEATVQKQE